jgi:hypothetical protein
MKKELLVYLIILYSSIAANSQITFEKNIGGYYDDQGLSVVQTNDGGYIISGMKCSSDTSCKSYLIKTNEYGDTLWTKTIGADHTTSVANSVIQTSDGGYVFTGSYRSETYSDVLIVKTNSSGDTLWSKLFGWQYNDEGWSVAQTYDGGYVITGLKQINFGNNCDVFLIKTDTAGNAVWIKTYGGNQYEQGYSVAQTSDSGFIIAGTTASYGTGTTSIYLIRTNQTGDTIWTKTYGGVEFAEGYSLIKTDDGGYLIAGLSFDYGSILGNQVYLVKTDANGDSIWTKTIGGVNGENALSVTKSNDGGYVITGKTYTSSSKNGVLMIKTNANGDSLWSKTFGGMEDDYGACIKATNDGGYIIAGTTSSFGLLYSNVYLIKTDGNGIVAGLEDYTNQSHNTTISPNPFSQSTQITLPQTYHNISLAVYDIQGKLLAQQQYKDCSLIQLNRNQLSNGLYFLKLTLDDKEVETGKIVIRE